MTEGKPLEQELWTIEQVAEILQLKPAFIRRQAAAGKIPRVKIGKLVRFTREHIDTIKRQSTLVPVPLPQPTPLGTGFTPRRDVLRARRKA